jgi:hypothetical protein
MMIAVRVGLISGEMLYASAPTLIGATAVCLSTTGLITRRGRPKAAAILGLVLGIATVVNEVWGIGYLDGLFAEPGAPVSSQTKPTTFGALNLSTLGK